VSGHGGPDGAVGRSVVVVVVRDAAVRACEHELSPATSRRSVGTATQGRVPKRRDSRHSRILGSASVDPPIGSGHLCTSSEECKAQERGVAGHDSKVSNCVRVPGGTLLMPVTGNSSFPRGRR
jgi:hypothetical protein